MKALYYNKQGKYQKTYDLYSSLLIPNCGKASTVEGELLRAITRICYDAYNNGFVNNTSGAINFLLSKVSLIETNGEVENALKLIAPITNTGGYASKSECSLVTPEIDLVIDAVVEYIHNQDCLFTKNDEDSFDYSDSDVYIIDLEEDTYYDDFED